MREKTREAFTLCAALILSAAFMLMMPCHNVWAANVTTPLDGELSEGTCAIVYHNVEGVTQLNNPQVYESGKKVSLKTPKKMGYKFNGWYADEAFSVRVKTIKKTVEPGEVIHLYAKWTPVRYKITYKVKNGKNIDNPTYYTVEDQMIRLAPPQVKAGMQFEGWYSDKRMTLPITEIDPALGGKKTVYGKCGPIPYIVHFDANGGVGNTEFEDISCTYGKKFVVPMIYALREGYTAVGFNTEPDGSGTEYMCMKQYSNIAKQGGTINLYIHWRKTSDIEKQYADEVVKLINQERRKAGLPELVADRVASAVAMQRAQDLSVLNSHNRPDKSPFREWIFRFRAFSNLRDAGENIASGYASPAYVMKGWMESPGHKANILKPGYNKVGVGCYYEKGRIYWTQEFITN